MLCTRHRVTYSSLFLQASSCRTSILLIVSRLFLSRLDSVTDGGGMIVGIEDDEGPAKRDIVGRVVVLVVV